MCPESLNPPCPKCQSLYTYIDDIRWVCPECSHEWSAISPDPNDAKSTIAEETHAAVIKDAHGNILQNGDSVIVMKDLKVKGASSTVKSGTKVRSIRLDDLGDGHNISCKVEGVGSIYLKSEFVKKST